MLGALKFLVITSLLSGGLVCPSSALMAGGLDDCGHRETDQRALQAAAEMMPCCLDSHRADTPIAQSNFSLHAISVVQPVFSPDSDDVPSISGFFVEKQKYRDKFEERSCGKRE